MRKSVYISLLAFTIAVAIYYPYSPGGRQQINMNKAVAHIATLLPKVRADARFDGIVMQQFTGAGGSLWVGGQAVSESAAQDIRRLVTESHPPVSVVFAFVVAPPATEPATTMP